MSKYQVETAHPVAVDSRDHTHPGGTQHDNSRNRRFNNVIYRLYPQLRLCDLGCAGGGFVKDCIDDGHEAIGLEGSDYSLLRKRAEWATIPDNLFTADITKPFTVRKLLYDNGPDAETVWQGMSFNVVTAWEVMEHIKAEDLAGLADNVRRHLEHDGVWVMSVSEQVGEHHVCVHNKDWWLNLFDALGWRNRPDILAHFDEKDWVRGPLQNAPQSFHLILSRKESS